ncbi:hypothetical protein [Streptomyces sp. DG1A-41]|uniref:hypothetical protein n=1 Tax=Streptomyces sp. DG1A-41 TaxID=3125779 RepID=UPI0030CA6C84
MARARNSTGPRGNTRHLTVEVQQLLGHLAREPRPEQEKALAQLAEVIAPLWHEGMNDRLPAMACDGPRARPRSWSWPGGARSPPSRTALSPSTWRRAGAAPPSSGPHGRAVRRRLRRTVPVTELPAGLSTGHLRLGPWPSDLPPIPSNAGPAKWRRRGLPWCAKPVTNRGAGFALRVARTDLIRAAARRLTS